MTDTVEWLRAQSQSRTDAPADEVDWCNRMGAAADEIALLRAAVEVARTGMLRAERESEAARARITLTLDDLPVKRLPSGERQEDQR